MMMMLMRPTTPPTPLPPVVVVSGFAETNETSLVEKLNKLKMGESIGSVIINQENMR